MNANNTASQQVDIIPATLQDIEVIQQIAYKTWPVAYGQILSNDQLIYMLDLIYSTSGLQAQMQNDQRFFIALHNDIAVGFASYTKVNEVQFKLQKLYVLPTVQKTGAGKKLLLFVEDAVKTKNGKSLLLNVNRKNSAINFYSKHGFEVIYEDDIDIGNGYFMNDYIMEKKLAH